MTTIDFYDMMNAKEMCDEFKVNDYTCSVFTNRYQRCFMCGSERRNLYSFMRCKWHSPGPMKICSDCMQQHTWFIDKVIKNHRITYCELQIIFHDECSITHEEIENLLNHPLCDKRALNCSRELQYVDVMFQCKCGQYSNHLNIRNGTHLCNDCKKCDNCGNIHKKDKLHVYANPSHKDKNDVHFCGTYGTSSYCNTCNVKEIYDKHLSDR